MADGVNNPPFPESSRDDILSLVGPVLFQRGLDYYESGMVEKVGWDGTILRGVVRGTSEPFYQVAIRYTESGWDTECTCPYDDVVCKHITAVMLATLGEKDIRLPSERAGEAEGGDELAEAEVRSFVFGMPKKELAETLWSLALDDPDLYRSLILKALSANGKKIDLAEFRRQIRSALSGQGFVEYGEVPTYTHSLEMVAQSLKEMARRGHPREAAELLESLINGCEKRLDYLDDSDGIFSDFIRSLFKEWGQLLAQVHDLDQKGLALRVLERLETDEYGLAQEIVPALAQALGKQGLDELKTLIRPRYEEERGKDTAKVKGTLFSINHSLLVYREALKDIANAQGDVDGYIALCKDGALHPSDCLEMARRLRKANRQPEALTMAEQGLGLRQGYDGLATFGLLELRIQLLVEMGQGEQALSAAWDYFREHPSTSSLDLLLSHVPEKELQSAREEALSYVLTLGSLSSAISICLREQEMPKLVRALHARQEELLRLDYPILAPLAKELEAGFPDLAIVVYRRLALDILEEKRSRAYHHAIAYLRRVKKLFAGSGRTAEWKKLSEEIKAGHGRKHSFMRLFERL